MWHTGWEGPFRKAASNRQWMLLAIMLTVNACFACASAFEVENPVMVASTQTLFLAGFNCLGFLGGIHMMLSASMAGSRRLNNCGFFQGWDDDTHGWWPPYCTLARIRAGHPGAARDCCRTVSKLTHAVELKV